MRSRFFAVAAIAVMLLNVLGIGAADANGARVKKAEVSRLISLLPASDGVVVFDSKRFVNDALPKILSANQPILAEITGKIAEMEAATGIDFRKFDQVAVGVAIKSLTPARHDVESVALASGDINAGALIAIAKLASKGTYREEKIGGKTVYVISAREVLQKTTPQPASSKVAGLMDKALKAMTKEVAVATLDSNTIAIGSTARIRQTLAADTRVSAEITGLLSVKETSVMSFAMKTPGGLSKMFSLDKDELGANLDAIDYFAGSMDVAAAGTSLLVTARTKKAQQAQGLKDTLDGLKMVGGAVFGGSKRTDQQIYGRLIKNAKVENRGSDVSLELLVPQADIDGLLAIIK